MENWLTTKETPAFDHEQASHWNNLPVGGNRSSCFGLIPYAAISNPWKNWEKMDQLETRFVNVNEMQSKVIAIGGFAADFILFRLGSHLKSKGKPPGSQPLAVASDDK